MFVLKYQRCYQFHSFAIILILAKVKANIEDYSTYKRMDLYKLEEWSPHYARFARRKAQLCLFHTDDNNVIFETEIFKEWFKEKKKDIFPRPVALEVVIGQRIEPINKATVLYRYDELENELGEFFTQNFFNDATALLRRGSVLQMGCDYLVRNNNTHLLTNLVCAYGILYFSDGITNDYSAIVGTSCSKCDFYSARSYFRSHNGSLPWGCLFTFAFLCGDPVGSPAHVEDFRYNCNGTLDEELFTPVAEETDFEIQIPGKDHSEQITEYPPHTWPCLRYAVPIILLISVMVIIILYQVYSVILIKLRSD